jgi:hypothetical protein
VQRKIEEEGTGSVADDVLRRTYIASSHSPRGISADHRDKTKGTSILREWAMTDDRSKTDSADRDRINMHEDYEVRYWSQKWQVNREQLADAVRSVGVMVKDVAAKLRKRPQASTNAAQRPVKSYM